MGHGHAAALLNLLLISPVAKGQHWSFSYLRQARLSREALAYILGLFVRSYVCYRTCEHGILKTNEPVLMSVGTSGPRGNGIK